MFEDKAIERGTVLYVRCSPADGDDPEYQSVDAQIDELANFAEQQGYKITCAYGDDGGTGCHFGRQGLLNMLRDAHNGKIGRILVTEMTRLGVESGSVLTIETILKEQGIELIYAHAAIGNGSVTDFVQGMNNYVDSLLSQIDES